MPIELPICTIQLATPSRKRGGSGDVNKGLVLRVRFKPLPLPALPAHALRLVPFQFFLFGFGQTATVRVFCEARATTRAR